MSKSNDDEARQRQEKAWREYQEALEAKRETDRREKELSEEDDDE